MTYYLIAGEASGDLHASNLMKALKRQDPAANFRFWGGDLMRAVGGTLVKHYQELAFMGFWEVLKNIRTISRNLSFCQQDIATFRPDVLILIDYSGFNLRIAKWAKQENIKVFYYIAPQVWASRQSRVKKIKQYVDQLFVILPFEAAFYQKFAVKANFVGHPLLDAIADFKNQEQSRLEPIATQPIIALLPGSRQQEVSAVLPMMLKMVAQFPAYQFVIGVAPSLPLSFYDSLLKDSGLPTGKVKLLTNQTYNLLSQAKAALVTSGTATLETALFEVPQVVCYKGNWLTYQIAKRIINVPYISLVNLIANRSVVKELIQEELTSSNLAQSLADILEETKAEMLKQTYQSIKKKLGNVGASERTAQLMLDYLQEFE